MFGYITNYVIIISIILQLLFFLDANFNKCIDIWSYDFYKKKFPKYNRKLKKKLLY